MPISCNCKQCQNMCRSSTCLCSPDGAQRLIDAGYGQRLAAYTFPGGSAIGTAPKSGGQKFNSTQQSSCSFFSESGGCELHNIGLKPLEGQLAHHTRYWVDVRKSVVRLWTPDEFSNLSSIINNSNKGI